MELDYIKNPPRIVGKSCLKSEPSTAILGKHAFIVCGRHGARACGALDDVLNILRDHNVAYTLFDRCRENPPLELCFEGGRLCAEAGADFVIGIGGGSALDAAKAIALFATNPTAAPEDVFDPTKRPCAPLPLVAIPTTAGTGSEANATGVLTLPGGEVKKSFASELPKLAVLDPQYLATLPYRQALSCALDAFAHSVESYLSPKATEGSREAATFAAGRIYGIIKRPHEAFDADELATLQAAAFAAGHAISVTGTGFPHPMGYSLTTLHGVPHGFACAVFYRHYIKLNESCSTHGRELVNALCRDALGGVSPDEPASLIPSLAKVELSLTEAEIAHHVELIKDAKNFKNSPCVLSDSEKLDIYRELFLRS